MMRGERAHEAEIIAADIHAGRLLRCDAMLSLATQPPSFGRRGTVIIAARQLIAAARKARHRPSFSSDGIRSRILY